MIKTAAEEIGIQFILEVTGLKASARGARHELEEREFVVDSGASMHMISKKDLNSAELETVTTSRSPTTVFTANDEVQTQEEATVYVEELEKFLTMKVLEDTPAVLSL